MFIFICDIAFAIHGRTKVDWTQCTFGILKGWWRIIKTGIHLHNIKFVDMIWLTCCALHNMLLNVDGLKKPWDGGHPPTSDYESSFGNLEFDNLPLAMQRLFLPYKFFAFNISKAHFAAGGTEGNVELLGSGKE